MSLRAKTQRLHKGTLQAFVPALSIGRQPKSHNYSLIRLYATQTRVVEYNESQTITRPSERVDVSRVLGAKTKTLHPNCLIILQKGRAFGERILSLLCTGLLDSCAISGIFRRSFVEMRFYIKDCLRTTLAPQI